LPKFRSRRYVPSTRSGFVSSASFGFVPLTPEVSGELVYS
jgi:hypothetical protein